MRRAPCTVGALRPCSVDATCLGLRRARRRPADRSASRGSGEALRSPPAPAARAGRDGRSSSRSMRRSSRRSVPRAESRRLQSRPGSRRRPSARGRSGQTWPTSPRSPPTCSSICSPTTVCVIVAGPLLLVERPRLVDDLGRDLDLADVVQQRGELDLLPFPADRAAAGRRRRARGRRRRGCGCPCTRRPPRSRRRAASPCRDTRSESSTVRGRPAACRSFAKAENVSRTHRAGRTTSSDHGLPCEAGSATGETDAARAAASTARRRRASTCSMARAPGTPQHRAGCSRNAPGARSAHELRGERGHVHRRAVPCRRDRLPGGQREDERGSDRMPRRDHVEREPVDRHAASNELRRRGEQEGGTDRERQQMGRHEKPHRHEHALGRERESAGELELHAGRDRVARNGHDERSDRQVAIRRENEDHRDGGDEEGSGEQAGRVAAIETPRCAGPSELDDRVVAQPFGRRRRKRPTHPQMIGTPGRGLDASTR